MEAKPVLTVEQLASDKELNDHDAEVEQWGARGWLQVGRLCRWAADMGMKGADCPKAPAPP